MSTQPNSTPETSGLIIETPLNGQVLSITITDSSRSTIDHYVEYLKKAEDKCPVDGVLYL
jgi:hypothetical protein